MIMSNSGDGSSSSSMDHHDAHLSQIVSGGVHHQLHPHHHHQGGVRGLKKGPWTAAEDSILMEYVKKHGEGNWNAVQKNAGLARCGKSCRLRWANHLRPNLKKGSLTADEERIIIELHAKYGNKWASMASQLPGRTDNEIKNYWNTRMKRRQRAGLPIYPHDLQHDGAAVTSTPFHHHQPHHHHNSNSSLSSLISSNHPRKANYTSLYDRISFDATQLHQNHTSLGYSSSRFNANGGGFAIPPSPVSSFGTSSNSGLFNQTALLNQTLMPTTQSHQYFNNSSGFGSYNSLNLTSMIMGAPPNAYESLNPELPSNQTTPPYSPYTKGEGLMEAAVDNGYAENGYEIEVVSSPGKRGSGLLDDVLVQASALSRKRSRSGGEDSESGESGQEKGNAEDDGSESGGEEEGEEENVQEETTWKSSGENSGENLRDGSSSPSVGMKPTENPLEDMDDDLLSLLNFQSTAPAVSDSWYVGTVSEQASPEMNGPSDVNASLDVPQNTTAYASSENMSNNAAETDDEIKRSLPPCFWNNMPGIC